MKIPVLSRLHMPITVKYSAQAGEILLSNPGLPPEKWRHNFKYYA